MCVAKGIRRMKDTTIVAEIILVFFTTQSPIECIIRFGFGAKRMPR